MLFNSIEFLIFFPIVTILYYLAPPPKNHDLGFRWIILLCASTYFYMCFIPKYIFVMLTLIIVDYFAAIKIEQAQIQHKKKYLVLSIFSTLSILFIFKYYNFFNTNFAAVGTLLGFNYTASTLNLIIPLGLSFHTFQSLSYVIEVYRGNQKAEKHFGIYSLYVMFYPQLCAGPIERPQYLLHQFRQTIHLDFKNISNGIKRMGWGLFKKIVIADHLAILVEYIYQSPTQHHGLALTFATLLFAFQMYADFSGYTDIAIGSAEAMGIEIRPNFIRPYFSKSISEYWRRWHISLSTWFRDYLYIPLGGKKVSKSRWYFNLLITFLASGLWHGANWTYICWGLLNGVYLVWAILLKKMNLNFIETFLEKYSPLILKYYNVITTFLLVCIGRIFTRSETISDAFHILVHIPKNWSLDIQKILTNGPGTLFNTSNFTIYISVLFVLILIFVDLIQRYGSIRDRLNQYPKLKWPIYWIITYSFLYKLFTMHTPDKEFIYFQF